MVLVCMYLDIIIINFTLTVFEIRKPKFGVIKYLKIIFEKVECQESRRKQISCRFENGN